MSMSRQRGTMDTKRSSNESNEGRLTKNVGVRTRCHCDVIATKGRLKSHAKALKWWGHLGVLVSRQHPTRNLQQLSGPVYHFKLHRHIRHNADYRGEGQETADGEGCN